MNSPKNAALRECVLVVCLVVPVVLMFCAVGVALDIHQARLEFTVANAEWRRETFLRLDRLLWKADTALEVAGALRLDLGNLLTKLRAQVQRSSEESTKATATQTKAAAVTVAHALDTTRQAIQAAAGDAVTAPPDPQAPITVNVPPPVLLPAAPPPAAAPGVEVTPIAPGKRRAWYSHLWRWW
jgi:hypothetical protein